MNFTKKTAAEIQRDLAFMRAMYAERRSLNQPRRDRMVGAILILCGIIALSLLVITFSI